MVHLYLLHRNQAYQTRVQLAVLDYNSHLTREKAKNKDGIQIYNRKFRKQTKKWDATPVLECKKYPHIPKLMKDIELEYKNRDNALRVQVESPYDNPTAIQKTIGNSQPEATSEIVQKKRTRFWILQHIYQEIVSYRSTQLAWWLGILLKVII